MNDRWAGLLLMALGAWAGWMAYSGFREGNTTLSALAPAHRDKQPINFWFCFCLLIAMTVMCVIGGLMAAISPSR